MNENKIGDIIIRVAIEIHREFGPGLFEMVYEAVLANELERNGLFVKRQVGIPIKYNGVEFKEGFRADIIVENKVIIEIKSLEHLAAVHKKQVLTYLRLSNMKLGYLLNFGESVLRKGISRIINGKIE